MRTKAFVGAAAAVVAGALSASAQVYSVNVVGYVNVACPANTFVLVATPLDAGTNDFNTLLAALPNKSSAQTWNGAGFTPSTKIAGTGWSPNQVVPPGTGFFVSSFNSTVTNTFVGNVVAAPGGGTVTNTLPSGVFEMVGSQLPYAGDLNDTNLNLIALPNKSSVQVWNGSGFTPSTKIAGTGWSPALTITPGQGFFVSSFGASVNWIQTLQ